MVTIQRKVGEGSTGRQALSLNERFILISDVDFSKFFYRF